LEGVGPAGSWGCCGSEPVPLETTRNEGDERGSDELTSEAPSAAGVLPDAALGGRTKGGGSLGLLPAGRSRFWMIGIVGLVGSSSSRLSGSSNASGR
jgi:hypothetical protein